MSNQLLPGLLLQRPLPHQITQRTNELADGTYRRLDTTLTRTMGFQLPVDATPNVLATLEDTGTDLDELLIRVRHTITHHRLATAPLLVSIGGRHILATIAPCTLSLSTPSDDNLCDQCLQHIANPHDPHCPLNVDL